MPSRADSDEGESSTRDTQIERLHAATRRLMAAQDETEIGTVAVEAATDILDFPFSVVWYADGDALEAAAASDPVKQHIETPANLSETMRHEAGSWFWDLYENDETQCVTISTDEAASDVPTHAFVAVPLDGYGLLTVGADDTTMPSETEVELVDILGRNVRSALSRTEREQRLEQQRDSLETVNRIVRHDVRNRLQIIDASADLLAEEFDGEPPEHLRTIRESAQSATELTETARDLVSTVLQADAALEPVSLRTTLLSRVDDLRSAHGDATVTVDGDVPRVDVRADEMLGSVFENVLTNAVQHNDAATPEVTVTVSERAETVRVSVADNGPGIPDDQKEAVFGKGEKGLESTGTGIGLYLVRTLVERYGGEVWVKDNDPTGTVVTLTLPRADS